MSGRKNSKTALSVRSVRHSVEPYVIQRRLAVAAALTLTAAGIAIRISLWHTHLLFKNILQPILGMTIAFALAPLLRKNGPRRFFDAYPVLIAKLLWVCGCAMAFYYQRCIPFWTPIIPEPWLCALCFVPACVLTVKAYRNRRECFYLYAGEYLVSFTITLLCDAYAAALMETAAFLVMSLFLLRHTSGVGSAETGSRDRARGLIILLLSLLISIVLLFVIYYPDITADTIRWMFTGHSRYPDLHGFDKLAHGVMTGAKLLGRADIDIESAFYDGFPFERSLYGYMITQVIYGFGWLPAAFLIALLLLVTVCCALMLKKRELEICFIRLPLYVCFTLEILFYISKDLGYKIVNVAYLPFVSANWAETALAWLFLLL